MSYELMIVAVTGNSDLLIERSEKMVKVAGGENIKVERLGRKKLAYPIRAQQEADYFLINFEAEGVAIGPISEKLRLEQEDLLRHLLLKTKVVKPSKKKTRVEEKKDEVPEVKAAPKVTVVTKSSPATSAAKASEVKKASEGKKVSKVKKTAGKSKAKRKK